MFVESSCRELSGAMYVASAKLDEPWLCYAILKLAYSAPLGNTSLSKEVKWSGPSNLVSFASSKERALGRESAESFFREARATFASTGIVEALSDSSLLIGILFHMDITIAQWALRRTLPGHAVADSLHQIGFAGLF